ncbi:MAG TPA: PQQ-binding-like beta-propeller repeat protein [Planctomycetota bacterium]|nr:PQQ-binding-like beta-propeller repeat protein [Planctomycetota bacterium]
MKLNTQRIYRALPALALTAICAFILPSCGVAGDAPKPSGGHDWPQWGGTDQRNMITDETNLPDAWDPGPKDKNTEEYDTSKSKNLKWIAKLGSQTYGNPTVAGGKIFVGTNNTSPRNPKYKDVDMGVLMCFNEADGKFLWQLTVPKLKSGKVNDWEYLGICSSPTVDGDRVYVVTNRCELLCLGVDGLAKGNRGPFKYEGLYVKDPDLISPKAIKGKKPEDLEKEPTDPDGADIIWRLDMIEELGVFPHNASNCSVLIDGDKLYCCTSNGVDWGHDNVPAPEAPSYFCANKMTGEILWVDEIGMGKGKRADCGLQRQIFHGQWTSPSLGVINGKKQVYFGGGDGFCYALDADTGKTVWKADCVLPTQKKNAKGFIMYPDYKGPSEINATPVLYKNRIYCANGQDPDHGEGVGVLTCLDATKTGDITDTGKVWVFDKINRSISTCSIYNDLLFICDFSGNVYCLDPETGKLNWKFDSGAHIWGSTLAGDGKVYFGNEDGDAFILAADKTLKEISKCNVGQQIFGTPVVAHGVMYIATQTHLFAITKK